MLGGSRPSGVKSERSWANRRRGRGGAMADMAVFRALRQVKYRAVL